MSDEEEYQNNSDEEETEDDDLVDEDDYDEDEEDDDYDEDDEDDDEEDEESGENNKKEKQNQLEKKINEIEEKILTPKIEAIDLKLATNSKKIMLNPIEKKAMERAKKHKKLLPKVLDAIIKLILNIGAFIKKIISIISPMIPAITEGALIIFLIISIISILSFVLPDFVFENLFGVKPDHGESGAVFGVKGDSFYGVRMIYRDDEQANIEQLESYINLATGKVEKILELTTLNVDGTEYSLQVTYTDAGVLSDDFKFDKTTFANTYPNLNTLLLDIAGKVYEADTGETGDALTLDEKLAGIKYFGLNIDVKADLETLVSDYVKANYTFDLTQEDSPVTDAEILEQAKTQLDEIVSGNLDEKYFTRTEKLFAKDFIFNKEDDYMKAFEKRQYVAMIYLPKTNVEFTSFAYNSSGIEINDFDLKMYNNGTEIQLKHDANNDMPGTNNKVYYFKTGDISVSTGTTDLVDATNDETLKVLSDGMSFGKLSTIVGDMNIYLKSTTDERGKEYYTYNTSGVYLTFSQETPTDFIFWELETLYK